MCEGYVLSCTLADTRYHPHHLFQMVILGMVETWRIFVMSFLYFSLYTFSSNWNSDLWKWFETVSYLKHTGRIERTSLSHCVFLRTTCDTQQSKSTSWSDLAWSSIYLVNSKAKCPENNVQLNRAPNKAWRRPNQKAGSEFTTHYLQRAGRVGQMSPTSVLDIWVVI